MKGGQTEKKADLKVCTTYFVIPTPDKNIRGQAPVGIQDSKNWTPASAGVTLKHEVMRLC